MNQIYDGKYYFAQYKKQMKDDDVWYIGREKQNAELSVNSTEYERFNLYKNQEGKIYLQAMNGLYVSYQSGYSACEKSRELACLFSLVLVEQNNTYQLVHEESDGIKYCMQIEDGRLKRKEWNSGISDPTCEFIMHQLSLGLKELVSFGGNGEDLTYADVHGSDFTFAGFTMATLDHANFSGCILKYTTMVTESTSAIGVNFTNCDFNNADMMNANFSESDFTGCDLSNANLSEANLTSCCFNKCNLTGARLNGTIMKQVVMENANAAYCNFETVDFTDAVLTGTDFGMAMFLNNNFTGAKLDHSKMMGSLFTECKVDQNTTFQSADLSKSRFNDMVLENAAFRNAILVECDFCGANLGNCDLSYANLTKANFAPSENGYAKLVGATLANCNLTNVNFKDAQLGTSGEVTGGNAADLTNAIMINAVFDGANLYGVNLTGVSWYGPNASAQNAQLQLTNFTNANLSRMKLTDARLNGCIFDYANLFETDFKHSIIAPVSNLRKTSFSKANLQSANFIDCEIRQAVFTDAAIAVNDGPYITMPYSDDEYTQPTKELETLMKLLNDSGNVPQEIYDVFKHAGFPLESGSKIELDYPNEMWHIINGNNKVYPRYNIYLAGDVIRVGGPAIGVALFHIPNVTKEDLNQLDRYSDQSIRKKDPQEMPQVIANAFINSGYELKAPRIEPNCIKGGKWLLANYTDRQTELVEGYLEFYLKAIPMKNSELYQLQVYGYTLATIRINSEHEKEQQTTYINTTALIQNHLKDETICPSGQKCELLYDKRENVRITWEEAMTASVLPKPPKDIPIW